MLLLNSIPGTWSQPLVSISEQSQIASIPFHQESQGQRSELIPSSYPASSSSVSSSSDQELPPALMHMNHPGMMSHGMQIMQNAHHHRNMEMGPRSPQRLGSLCSLFRTFLDARSVNCRVSLPNPNRIHRRISEEEEQGGRPDLDTNALVQIQSESGSRIEGEGGQGQMGSLDRMDTHLGNGSDEEDEQDDDEELRHQYHMRLHQFRHRLHGHGHGPPPRIHDETKILQDKTTIIVPERPCQIGQRRDPGGYCRTVLRIRPYYGQQLSVRPIKYYYRRFVSVPTLHFILPH